MAGSVRIELCRDQAAARRRADFLVTRGWTVHTTTSDVDLTIVTVDAVGNLNETANVLQSPFLVVATLSDD